MNAMLTRHNVQVDPLPSPRSNHWPLWLITLLLPVAALLNLAHSASATAAEPVLTIKPKILTSFGVPGNGVTGLAWGDNSLWVTDKDGRLFRLDATGAIQSSVTMTDTVTELSWHDGGLWAYAGWGDIYRVDATGQTTTAFVFDYWADGALEWAGDALFVSDFNGGTIHVHNTNGTHLRSWEASIFGHPVGMAYDGDGLWLGDSCEGDNSLYRYSLQGILQAQIYLDSVGIECPSGFNTRALAWDGQALWYSASDAQIIYRLDLSSLFQDSKVALPALNSPTAAWGDYDNDGDLDFVIAGRTIGAPTSRIYRNDGDGAFTDIHATLMGVYDGSATWGDADNDGYLDLLLTGCIVDDCSAWTARLYHNNGNGSFTNLEGALPAIIGSAAAWGDYDNDGDLDILLAGYKGGGSGLDNPPWTTQVMQNDGHGVFMGLAGLAPVYGGMAAWADYDNDGDLDLLLAGCRDYTCSLYTETFLYRFDGDGAFTVVGDFVPAHSGSVDWGDYDSDGDLDILLSGSTGWAAGAGSFTKVYRNDGQDAFTDIQAALTGVVGGSATWGDYDNDGDLDILMTGDAGLWPEPGVTRVYRNDGSGDFADLEEPLLPNSDGSAAWGDYDSDGDLDILLAGDGVARIYRNNTTPANTRPTAPSGLTATVDGTSVILNWNAASDGQTPAAALAYSLRMGTTPGGLQVVVPLSSGGGYRQVPRLDNSHMNRSWRIRNLQPEITYFWSVQAIDASFAGSPFAAEVSVTIPRPPDHVLIVSLSGNGTGTINGLPANLAAVPHGTHVTLTVQPANSSTFGGWSGACTNNTGPCVITMDGNKSVTATFVLQELAVDVMPAGSGGTVHVEVVTPDVAANAALRPVAARTAEAAESHATYPFGTVLLLTAIPASGHAFAGWSGSLNGSQNPTTVTVARPLTIHAVFVPIQIGDQKVYLPTVQH